MKSRSAFDWLSQRSWWSSTSLIRFLLAVALGFLIWQWVGEDAQPQVALGEGFSTAGLSITATGVALTQAPPPAALESGDDGAPDTTPSGTDAHLVVQLAAFSRSSGLLAELEKLGLRLRDSEGREYSLGSATTLARVAPSGIEQLHEERLRLTFPVNSDGSPYYLMVGDREVDLGPVALP